MESFADEIDNVIGLHAKPICDFLDEKGYKSVGVLNFSLKRDRFDKSPTYQAGPITRNCAIRLQNAMALFSSLGLELRIINDANATIEKHGIRSIENEADRSKLFSLDYPILALPVPKTPIKADVFVCGEVNITADNMKANIVLKYFDNQSVKTPKEFYQFSVPTDLTILAECGISFSLDSRDLDKTLGKNNAKKLNLEDKIRLPEDFLKESTTSKKDENKNGASGGNKQGIVKPCIHSELAWNNWVDLIILYDDVPQEYYQHPTDNSKYTIKEPQAGQKVVIKLKNKSAEKLGVTLFVNKLNVFNSELQDTRLPADFSKIILTPMGQSSDEWTIKGFYKLNSDDISKSDYDPFRITTDAETKKLLSQELGKSNHLGHITMYVFGEGSSAPVPSNGIAKAEFSGGRKQISGNEKSTSLMEEFRARLDGKGVITSSDKSEKQELSLDNIKNPVLLTGGCIRYLSAFESNAPKVEKK